MMTMNCFCGMVDRISDTLHPGFEFAQKLTSGFIEWICAVVFDTQSLRHNLLDYILANLRFHNHMISNSKFCLALFSAETIVRDPHNHESPGTPRAEFEPAQNLSSGFVEWSCAVVITTIPRRHNLLDYILVNLLLHNHMISNSKVCHISCALFQ